MKSFIVMNDEETGENLVQETKEDLKAYIDNLADNMEEGEEISIDIRCVEIED